jgi:copper chaperone CopZ
MTQCCITEVMTKVQLDYPLVRPFADADAQAIVNVHSWYGIMRVKVAPSLDRISVEYDASRLSEKDVEDVMFRFAIPIRRQFTV